jgi:uncharacterized damage-inducible protein DinB
MYHFEYMTAHEASRLIRYSSWASRRVVEAALQLSTEDLERPNAISHGSIAGTLTHIYLADRVWQERVMEPGKPVVWEATLADMQAGWPVVQKAWETWADSLADSDLDRKVQYKSIMFNTEAENTASEIVTHVVNHATLHRGQVVGMLRQLGVKPPGTDFIIYLRELTAMAAGS